MAQPPKAKLPDQVLEAAARACAQLAIHVQQFPREQRWDLLKQAVEESIERMRKQMNEDDAQVFVPTYRTYMHLRLAEELETLERKQINPPTSKG